jgi:hypothetical protein
VGTFETELLTPRLASFTATWTDDTTPGSLAVTVGTLNFDLSTGQLISFDDLFTDPGTALTIMSATSADLLYYQLGAAWDDALGRMGTTPNHANFANWVLTRAGLKVVFNQYQVVYSAQIPSVVVPWSALVPVLAANGPVADLSGASAAQSSPSLSPSPSASPSPTDAGTSPSAPPGPTDEPSPSPSIPTVS